LISSRIKTEATMSIRLSHSKVEILKTTPKMVAIVPSRI